MEGWWSRAGMAEQGGDARALPVTPPGPNLLREKGAASQRGWPLVSMRSAPPCSANRQHWEDRAFGYTGREQNQRASPPGIVMCYIPFLWREEGRKDT